MDKPLTTAEAAAAFRVAVWRLVADLYRSLRFRKTADGFDRWAVAADADRQRIRQEALSDAIFGSIEEDRREFERRMP